jgi:MFS family permease
MKTTLTVLGITMLACGFPIMCIFWMGNAVGSEEVENQEVLAASTRRNRIVIVCGGLLSASGAVVIHLADKRKGQFMRYFVAGLSFLLVWVGVAVVVGLILALIVPPQQPWVFLGIGFDLRTLSGTILGLLAGVHAARTSLRFDKEKDAKRAERGMQSEKRR